jgi:hypothetical protein
MMTPFLMPRKSHAAAILWIAGLCMALCWSGTTAYAHTSRIIFAVNGDTTETTMVQGDNLSWGADCGVGATMLWEIWYDINGNSVINDPGDKLVNSYTIIDGDTNPDGPPPDNDSIPDGSYMTPAMLLGIAPGIYVFRVTDQSDNSIAFKAITVTALPSPPNTFAGRLVVPGHPAPDAAVLANQWIEASLEHANEMWSALSDDSGKFTINVGPSGTDVTFRINPPDIPGYVTPARQEVVASGQKTLPNFVYVEPTDSIYGTVKDEDDQDLTVQPYVYANPQFGGSQKEMQVSGGGYKLYFGPSERGIWWVGVSEDQLIPFYMVPISEAVDNSTIHSIQHDIVCLKADTTIFVKVTENSGQPAHPYRVQVTQTINGNFTSAVTGTGASNIAPLHVSHLYDTGWYAMVVTWDSAYQIPPGLVLDGVGMHAYDLGDTITLNFVSGKKVSDTLKVDAGDPIPNLDSVWVGLCNIDGCNKAAIDQNGIYTVYGDTGEYSLNAFCTGYLTTPLQRPLHLLDDTTGAMGFTLNQAHCRIHGTLTNIPLPLSSLTIVNASTGPNDYTTTAQVDWATGAYNLYLCDGDWTITPPFITDRNAPVATNLTIGEAPDTVHTLNFAYTLISDVGDNGTMLPKSFALRQNVPNPFNPSTTISFDLPRQSGVELAVYNVLGQKIATLAQGDYAPGTYTVNWDGKDERGSAVATGIYFYRIVADNYRMVKKMLLMR